MCRFEEAPAQVHLARNCGSWWPRRTGDGTNTSETLNEAIRIYNSTSAGSYHLRGPQQSAAFFDGLELVNPVWSRL
jgi:hypothetical protein